MSSEMQKTLKSILKKVESRANYLYKYHYKKYLHIHYNNLIVENLMCNGRCHIVAVFKNYLIEDDNSEYLRRFYKMRESAPRLKKLFLYHDETSVIFPNYTPLVESKYLYNNVIKKQRVIDEQQALDNIRNDLKLNKKNKELLKKEEKVFNSTVFGEILTSSDSVLRIMFGIENFKNGKSNSKENKEKNNKEIDSTFEDYEDLKHLIKEVENAEEKKNNSINNNTLAGYRLGSNNVLKYKLKLLNNSNNKQIKNKNSDKLNNITNNSTNITSSSNNINSTINLIKIKNNQNLNLNDNFQIYNNGKNLNQKLRNSLSIKNPTTKIQERINFNNNMTIPNHKKNKSTLPNRTLYGLNFHSNNNNFINTLINQEKNINLRNISGSHSNNGSKININVNNNNYIYNNNFPFNSKTIDKNNNFLNNNINTKYNLYNKSNKILNKIPKLDIHKLDLINRKNDKILTLTNRNSNRNYHNHILNNPNLFFVETEVLKTERNLMKKRTKKKDILKTTINTGVNFSPSNFKSKVIFQRNSNNKLLIINEQNLKSISQRKKNIQYFSNKSINKSSKKLIINDYNFKSKK